MDEKSVFDITVDILLDRQRLVKTELQRRFKRTKPFRMEPVKDEDLLYDYNTKGMEIAEQIFNAQGEEATKEYINSVEQLKLKLGGA